jgi:ribonuclease HI
MAMSEHPIVVFCDGASKGNPGPGGWGVVIVTPDGRVTELGGHAANTTNNKMELTGAIEALAHVERVDGRVAVYTDSTYVIKGIQEWIWGWRRRGWKTAEGGAVQNREFWERLHALVEGRGKGTISWHYVRGHVGIPGNERVDEIADGLARQQAITLYRGTLADYGRPILDLPADTTVPKRDTKGAPAGKTKTPAHSYLSLVDGKLMRHSTWAECERRVKGRSGALYKKAQNESDEVAILRGWRVDPKEA